MEFVPPANGGTEINTYHHHNIVGGTWIQRWCYRRSERRKIDKEFGELIDRCQAEVGPSAS